MNTPTWNNPQYETQQFNLHDVVSGYLTLPEKSTQQDRVLPRTLWDFLVNKWLIQNVWINNWWWFSYHSGKKEISISRDPMPQSAYKYYVFRLGKDVRSWKNLFPQPEEMDQYRFLHETSHAYQQYLMEKESPDNAKMWYDKVQSWEIDSTFGILFLYCLTKRLTGEWSGLSTYGNVPDYNSIRDHHSQQATRAIEDANELITMYLWNPEYFETFLNYIAGDIPWYGLWNLQEDKLLMISNTEKQWLKNAIQQYIEEMKQNLSTSTKSRWVQEKMHTRFSQLMSDHR